MASFLDSNDEAIDSAYHFVDSDHLKVTAPDSPIFNSTASFSSNDAVFAANPAPESPIYAAGGGLFNGSVENGVVVDSNGPILPPMEEMEELGFALREWRRQNAIQLEEKEKKEKEILSQIIEEANDYKVAFNEKRKVTCENNKTTNREKEKVFIANHEKFHKEADKNYWKAISELIPNEVPALEKRRGKKDPDSKNKPSVVVVQGPKPGKPTDRARMRQILVKLKHTTPPHLTLSPPPPPPPTARDKAAAAPEKAAVVVAGPEAVVAA